MGMTSTARPGRDIRHLHRHHIHERIHGGRTSLLTLTPTPAFVNAATVMPDVLTAVKQRLAGNGGVYGAASASHWWRARLPSRRPSTGVIRNHTTQLPAM